MAPVDSVDHCTVDNMAEDTCRRDQIELLLEGVLGSNCPADRHRQTDCNERDVAPQAQPSILTERSHVATVGCVLECLLRLTGPDTERAILGRLHCQMMGIKTIAIITVQPV